MQNHQQRTCLVLMALLALSARLDAQFIRLPFPAPFPGVLPEPLPGVFPEPAPPPPPPPAFLRGDVNQDGQVNFSDVSFVLNYNSFDVGPRPQCFQTADVNNDNFLNLTLAPMIRFNGGFAGGLPTIYPSDLGHLAGWAYRLAPQPAAPFPTVGQDPDGNSVGCGSYSIDSPGGANTDWKYEWTFQTNVQPGSTVPFYLLGTTRSPISGFSLLYRFDRQLVKHITADFTGTHVPTGVRQELLDSPLVQVLLTDSSHNRYGLLAVTVMYGLPIPADGGAGVVNVGGRALEPLDIRPMRNRITQEILLRLLVDLKESADVSEQANLLLRPTLEDENLIGLHNTFFRLGTGSFDPIRIGRIEPATFRPGDDLFFRGDFNASGQFDLADPMATLSFLFQDSQIAPRCLSQADSNADGDLNIADALYSLLSVFDSAPNPFQDTRRTCVGPEGLFSGIFTFDATRDTDCQDGHARCVNPDAGSSEEWQPVADEPLVR